MTSPSSASITPGSARHAGWDCFRAGNLKHHVLIGQRPFSRVEDAETARMRTERILNRFSGNPPRGSSGCCSYTTGNIQHQMMRGVSVDCFWAVEIKGGPGNNALAEHTEGENC
ncbi:hypothetical protein PoB_000826600 [Plakobranchus ocellatus]|uniref:Uncharacterized protein n=1 Tax=Plakobranchus ocellatus TaxID=259542 RepID=A0AAV3YHB3_9GAST|nr:hypothetical protein PoB_000826600 [Plakobranchus ocellatus]